MQKPKPLRTAIYLKKDIVNTSVRKDFIINILDKKIEDFKTKTNLDVRVSGYALYKNTQLPKYC